LRVDRKVSKEKRRCGERVSSASVRKSGYESGRELDWMVVGFSAAQGEHRFVCLGVGKNAELLAKLGKHKTARAVCTSTG